MEEGQQFIAVAQKDPEVADPTLDALYSIGTIAKITRVEQREGGAQVIVQGDRRVRLLSEIERDDYLIVVGPSRPLALFQLL